MKATLLVLVVLSALCTMIAPTPAKDDPKPAVPVNLVMNTETDEDDPHISSDGRTLFYSSNPKGNYDIFFSSRLAVNQPWRKGQLFDDYLNSKDHERSIFVTPEGRYPQFMYAATRKAGKEVSKPNFDLYVSIRHRPGAAFTAPTPLNAVDTEADEKDPWLSADGRRLYYSRQDDDGWHVYFAARADPVGPQGFMNPTMLKDLPVNFYHPTLSPDSKTMYLQGPVENDRYGLFVSTFNGGKWSEPAALTINSAEASIGDTSPCLSRDGKLLYFSSDRPGGKGKKDLWVIPTDQLKKVVKDK